MPLYYSYYGVIWPVLAKPLLGLLYAFLSLDYSDPALSLGLPSCYLGFLDPFHCLWASSAHFFLLKHPWPIFFPWASLAYPNSAFPWAFANSFGPSWPNYLILYPWDSWAFHQSRTHLLHYFKPALAHSYFSTTHGFTTSLGPLASFKAHLSFYGLMIHHSYHSGLMVFLSIY